jgi:hypothetical protein
VTSHAYPFPKRITLHKDSPLLSELDLSDRRHELTLGMQDRYLAPEDVGSKVGRAAPARWLVFLSEDRQGPPRLRPMAKAEAVERMARNAFNLDVYGDRGVILLSRVAAEADAFVVEGGSASERADLIAERLLA